MQPLMSCSGLQGHTSEVSAVLFPSNKPWVASCSGDSTVKMWDFKDNKLVYSISAHDGGVTCMARHAFLRTYSKHFSESGMSRFEQVGHSAAWGRDGGQGFSQGPVTSPLLAPTVDQRLSLFLELDRASYQCQRDLQL